MTDTFERAVTFDCAGDRLLGILHEPTVAARRIGVLVVVGGPQYRVGSHRQFVLLARALAARGYPVLRFDHRGVGDSEGEARSFEALDEDLRAALDTLHGQVPGLAASVVFGLCDAASAALMYCGRDPRIAGLALANPWVHTEAGGAQAYVRHYYGRRLLQRSFWRKLAAGEFAWRDSLGDLLRKLRLAVAGSRAAARPPRHFRERMLEGLAGFRGPVLVQLSGRDLTAAEFTDLCQSDPRWRAAVERDGVELRRYEQTDHTFAAGNGLAAAIADCAHWLDALPAR
jgi:uncharacterized protein